MKDSLKEALLPLYRANCPYLLLLSFMLKYNLTIIVILQWLIIHCIWNTVVTYDQYRHQTKVKTVYGVKAATFAWVTCLEATTVAATAAASIVESTAATVESASLPIIAAQVEFVFVYAPVKIHLK